MGFVLAASLLAASVTAVFLTYRYSGIQYQTLGNICQEIVEKQPEAEQAVLSALKDYKAGTMALSEENILRTYGYEQMDFMRSAGKHSMVVAATVFLAGGVLFFIAFLLWHKRDVTRIQALTDYLEKINTGSSGVLLPAGEDEFSKLQDEIYKTVTELHQTKEEALRAKNKQPDGGSG